ncbi:hypothetical protein FQA47_015437 [Oryzias melastigma]|uniref:Uncharacterized protein n=1 Tax=Oryzias melastigma TaxID=30732 RepID=A0A834F847_ORYME|nr:hypothetical protein FQA47_015437 [Oryzias melastigma]
MPRLSSCFLVLIAVWAMTGQNTTDHSQSPTGKSSNLTTAVPTITSDNAASSSDLTTTESNAYSSASTKSKGGNSTTQDGILQSTGSTESTTMSAPPPPPTPPHPPSPHSPTPHPPPTAPATRNSDEKSTTVSPNAAGSDKTGIIILIVLILLTFVLGVACFFARGRGRRYSVDITSRPDEVTVPLSAVEAELPADSGPEKELQTFQSTENPAEEAEVKPEAQEEQKEADKPAVDPSAESAAASSSDDKPKEDDVENIVESSPAPAEVTVEEKTDDEGAASNKTSVESLKETNENSSNNVGLCHRGGWCSASCFHSTKRLLSHIKR